MASHALKMLTMFILLAGFVNFTYYAAYWKYPPRPSAIQRMKFHKRNDLHKHANKQTNIAITRNNTGDDSELKMPLKLIKVILMPGPKPHIKLRRSVKVYWTPVYLCGENVTNIVQETVTTASTGSQTKSEIGFEYTTPSTITPPTLSTMTVTMPTIPTMTATTPTTLSTMTPTTPSTMTPATASTLSPTVTSTITITTTHSLLCPEIPPLLGRTNFKEAVIMKTMDEVLSKLERGGSFKPQDCLSTETVAIIVPYRGPDPPLVLFLYSVHLSIIKQMVEYQIFVVKEINDMRPLNTGMLFNIGFLETQKIRRDINFTCLVFHDPYLAPADSHNLYRCSEQPKQLVASVDNNPYENEFGGVVAIRPEVFRAVNGFSNMYTDSASAYLHLFNRLKSANYTIVRPFPEYALFNSLHTSNHTEPMSMSTPIDSSFSRNVLEDGLTNLSSYARIFPEFRLSHTRIEVDTFIQDLQLLTISTRPSNPMMMRQPHLPSTTSKPLKTINLKV